ncbi:MAG: PIG-L deacetylase family protein [Candidatus Limnocylindrales bacterium]
MSEDSAPRLHDDRPERVMVIVAHPDDADFGPAGSVARWVRAGSVAHLVCCTSGDAGADDARTDPLELARTREAEQRAAALHVGYAEVTFLHQPDGALANDLALREQLVRCIRAFRPDAVLAPDPTVVITRGGHIQHTDHRAAAMAALDAVYPAARNALAFPHLVIHEGLEPHVVRWLYLFWTDRPDAWVDISDTLDIKLLALHEHATQIRDPEGFDERIREWSAEDAGPFGVAGVDAFRVLDLG